MRQRRCREPERQRDKKDERRERRRDRRRQKGAVAPPSPEEAVRIKSSKQRKGDRDPMPACVKREFRQTGETAVQKRAGDQPAADEDVNQRHCEGEGEGYIEKRFVHGDRCRIAA